MSLITSSAHYSCYNLISKYYSCIKSVSGITPATRAPALCIGDGFNRLAHLHTASTTVLTPMMTDIYKLSR